MGDSKSRTIISQGKRITKAQQIYIEEGSCKDGTEKWKSEVGDTHKEDLGVNTGQEVQEKAGDSGGTVSDKGINATQSDKSPLKKLPAIVSHQEGEVEFTREENENIEYED
ncbi:hypothetical protein HAX54_013977, partial [Datura stramonium]|nr:hypothetical protein [Datura stramonium]